MCATVTFRLGALDIAAWVTRAVPFVDLGSWIQSLATLLSDLRDPAGRHVFFEATLKPRWCFAGAPHRFVSSPRMGRNSRSAATPDYSRRSSPAFPSFGPSLRPMASAGSCTGRMRSTSWTAAGRPPARLESPGPGALERTLEERTSCERRSPPKTLRRPCWVAHVPGLEHSVGFVFGGSMSCFGFPPRQIVRVRRSVSNATSPVLPPVARQAASESLGRCAGDLRRPPRRGPRLPGVWRRTRSALRVQLGGHRRAHVGRRIQPSTTPPRLSRYVGARLECFQLAGAHAARDLRARLDQAVLRTASVLLPSADATLGGSARSAGPEVQGQATRAVGWPPSREYGGRGPVGAREDVSVAFPLASIVRECRAAGLPRSARGCPRVLHHPTRCWRTASTGRGLLG